MSFKLPTIEEIYSCYHRETFFAMKSSYPKSIKNFDKVITDEKRELLINFQNFLKRNLDLVDWQIYIKSCAMYFKRTFDLKILGSLKGNKIYRTYVTYNKILTEKTTQEIKSEILNSLKFLKEYINDSNISISDYFKDRIDIIPLVIRHIYSGTVSLYFYSCLPKNVLFKIFEDINDDIFFECFNYSKSDFIQCIFNKRDKIIGMSEIFLIIKKIESNFIKYF